MRRRKNVKTRMKDDLIDAFQDSIIGKLQNRHMLLCPFPLDPMELYRSLWTPAQLDGLAVLDNVDNLFSRRVQMHLRIPLTGDDSDESDTVHIYVTLEQALPMGNGEYDEIDYTKLSEEELAMVRSWVVDWQKFKADTEEVEQAVRKVVKVSNSIGQVVRLWPDLIGFMSSNQQDQVKRQAARSPIPKGAMEYYHDDEGKVRFRLAPDFQPERFRALHDLIAEALMLPEYDDLRHVATHEWRPRAKIE